MPVPAWLSVMRLYGLRRLDCAAWSGHLFLRPTDTFSERGMAVQQQSYYGRGVWVREIGLLELAHC